MSSFIKGPKCICFVFQVREVEYVDKMEAEWEMFQRAMKEETHVSEGTWWGGACSGRGGEGASDPLVTG